MLYRCGPNGYQSSLLVTACRYLFFCVVIGSSTETERRTLVSFLCRCFLHLNGRVCFNEVNQLKETHGHMTSLWVYPCDNNGIGCSIVKTRHTQSSVMLSHVTDTFAACSLTVEFQALLLQVFDSVFVTSAKIHSKIVGIDCHLDLSQEEQSLAVAVMALRRKLTFSFL